MTLKTRKWLEGLMQAFFSGLSSALAVNLVDPSDFGILDPVTLQKTAAVAGITAVVQLFQYLARTPMPEIDQESGRETVMERVRSFGTGDGADKGV